MESTPTKEQAVIIEAKEGIALKDYALAVTKLIGSKNLKFISRFSKDKICVTLSSKKLVEQITFNNKTIDINEYQLCIKPLTAIGQRMLFCNVCPWIPDSVLADSMAECGIELESDISFVKADLGIPELSHLNSHERQAYINPEDRHKIPEGGKLKVKWGGVSYDIHVSVDSNNCPICDEDHIARQGTSAESSMNTDETNNHSVNENRNAEEAKCTTKIKLERSEISFTMDTASTSKAVNNN